MEHSPYPPTKKESCRHCGKVEIQRRKGTGKPWPPNNTRNSRDYYYVCDPCQCAGAVEERGYSARLSAGINGLLK